MVLQLKNKSNELDHVYELINDPKKLCNELDYIQTKNSGYFKRNPFVAGFDVAQNKMVDVGPKCGLEFKNDIILTTQFSKNKKNWLNEFGETLKLYLQAQINWKDDYKMNYKYLSSHLLSPKYSISQTQLGELLFNRYKSKTHIDIVKESKLYIACSKEGYSKFLDLYVNDFCDHITSPSSKNVTKWLYKIGDECQLKISFNKNELAEMLVSKLIKKIPDMHPNKYEDLLKLSFSISAFSPKTDVREIYQTITDSAITSLNNMDKSMMNMEYYAICVHIANLVDRSNEILDFFKTHTLCIDNVSTPIKIQEFSGSFKYPVCLYLESISLIPNIDGGSEYFKNILPDKLNYIATQDQVDTLQGILEDKKSVLSILTKPGSLYYNSTHDLSDECKYLQQFINKLTIVDHITDPFLLR